MTESCNNKQTRTIILPPAPVGQIKFAVFKRGVRVGHVYGYNPEDAAEKLHGKVIDSMQGFACVTCADGNFCLSW